MLAGLARGPHPETGVVDRVVIDVAMPRESLFGRICKRASHAFGHLFTLIIFWTAVAVWLGLGPANDWSDDWQLLMNSASSVRRALTGPELTAPGPHGPHLRLPRLHP